MYVSIDMDKLVFLHKHHDHETLSALAWLEAPDRSICVENTDRASFLKQMSTLDLRLLYRNTCDHDLPRQDDWTLRNLLHGLITRLPATLALAEEVAIQVAAVEQHLHNGIAYKYVLGSKVPAAPQELFPLKGNPYTMPEIAKVAERSPGEEPEPAPVVAQASPAPAANVVKAPKQTGVRQIVYAAADRAMEALGTAAFFADWAAQRTALVAKLVADGYHQTTVRIKLSEWAKNHGI